MKRFVLHKIAISLLLFTVPVCVVSMESSSLKRAWEIANDEFKLNIPKNATLEEVDAAVLSYLNSEAFLDLGEAGKALFYTVVSTIKNNIKAENAYEWIKENKEKIENDVRRQITAYPEASRMTIANNILHILPSYKDKNYGDFDDKIINDEAMKIVDGVIKEMEKPQPQPEQKQPESKPQQKPSAHVEQPSPFKPVHVDPAGSEPKMPTGSQSQSAKPNAHRLRRAGLPGASDSATTMPVEQWLDDNNDYVEKLITDYFKNQESLGFYAVNIKAADVLEDVIENLKQHSKSYREMSNADKIVLHNRIKILLIPDIQKRFNQENELRRRQQQVTFNPNASNMVTAALELASMLNR